MLCALRQRHGALAASNIAPPHTTPSADSLGTVHVHAPRYCGAFQRHAVRPRAMQFCPRAMTLTCENHYCIVLPVFRLYSSYVVLVCKCSDTRYVRVTVRPTRQVQRIPVRHVSTLRVRAIEALRSHAYTAPHSLHTLWSHTRRRSLVSNAVLHSRLL